MLRSVYLFLNWTREALASRVVFRLIGAKVFPS